MTYRTLDIDQAAEYTCTPPQELEQAVRQGRLRAFEADGRLYFIEADLNRFLAGQPPAPDAGQHPAFDETTCTEERTYNEALQFAGGCDDEKENIDGGDENENN